MLEKKYSAEELTLFKWSWLFKNLFSNLSFPSITLEMNPEKTILSTQLEFKSISSASIWINCPISLLHFPYLLPE